MRKMFSEKQIEKLSREVSQEEIKREYSTISEEIEGVEGTFFLSESLSNKIKEHKIGVITIENNDFNFYAGIIDNIDMYNKLYSYGVNPEDNALETLIVDIELRQLILNTYSGTPNSDFMDATSIIVSYTPLI